MEKVRTIDLINTLKLEIMDNHELIRLNGCSNCIHTNIDMEGIGVCKLMTKELRTELAKKGISSTINIEVDSGWSCNKYEQD